MLQKQQKEAGKAIVTTVLFDHDYDIVHDRCDINKVKPLSDKEYFVRGSTTLLDAVGTSINKIIQATRNTVKEQQASNVMFVIITDGMENDSREYSYQKVRAMIYNQKEKYNWEFIFLAANIDAIETASRFGIQEDRAVTYHSDSQGTKLNYAEVSDVILNMRMKNKVDSNWKQNIEKDYTSRKNKKI